VNIVKLKPVDSVPVNGGMASSTDVIREIGESLKGHQTVSVLYSKVLTRETNHIAVQEEEAYED
jgi:hypothetical protein